MFRKFTCLCVGILFAIGFSSTANAATTKATATKPALKPTKSEAIIFARKLGLGWNLGNTLEATGDWIKGKSVSDYETAWGNPVTSKAMFDGVKASGFNFVRIPVAWSNLMRPDYSINKALMDRVEEVAKYGLDNNMYVMINIHWDGGWIHKFSTDYDGTMKKYKAVWSQIAARFQKYSNHLVFESLNEEGAFPDLWNTYGGLPNNKERAYKILNNINQEFTNLIRASGGNNKGRYLLIAGYGTDIRHTVNPAFKMPHDPVRHSMVSVHYYSPPTFAILDKDASWGKSQYTWGTPDEVAAVKKDLLLLKNRFHDKGIPVVVGEFGCPTTNKDPDSVVKYLSTVCETAYALGYVPVFWDAGNFYDRRELKWKNPKIGQLFASIAVTRRP